MFKFLTTKPLWVNIIAGIVIIILLMLLFFGSLGLLTRHGATLKIPAVTGQSLADARKTLETQGFEVQIQDSVYFDTIAPLQVIKQFPEADNLVKENRKVFLTINRSVPPFVEMPNMVNMTFRNADMVLKQYGLKLEDTVFRPDFAKNAVLDQLYQGQSIKPGTKIQQGSKITLVLGNGIGDTGFLVPDLVGLTYNDAKIQLEADGLILGAAVINRNVTDTSGAFVYRQSPVPFNMDEKKPNRIRQGQSVDLWMGIEKPVKLTDSTNAQPH